jgi:hypothetical protein
MNFKILSALIAKYNIPKDVKFLSDSGWECDPTDMGKVYFCEKENTLIFTQSDGYKEDCSAHKYWKDPDYRLIYDERRVRVLNAKEGAFSPSLEEER